MPNYHVIRLADQDDPDSQDVLVGSYTCTTWQEAIKSAAYDDRNFGLGATTVRYQALLDNGDQIVQLRVRNERFLDQFEYIQV